MVANLTSSLHTAGYTARDDRAYSYFERYRPLVELPPGTVVALREQPLVKRVRQSCPCLILEFTPEVLWEKVDVC